MPLTQTFTPVFIHLGFYGERCLLLYSQSTSSDLQAAHPNSQGKGGLNNSGVTHRSPRQHCRKVGWHCRGRAAQQPHGFVVAMEGPSRSQHMGSSCTADGFLTAGHTIHIYRVSSVTGIPKPHAESSSKDVIKSVKWLGQGDAATDRFQLSAQSQATGND